MKFFVFLLLVIPVSGNSQDIKLNEIDGFTGLRVIETSIISLKAAYTTGLGIYFSSSGDHYLVNIVGYGDGLGPVKKIDNVFFLMEDGLILTTVSIGDQPANDGGFTKVFQHHYLTRMKDLIDLKNKKTRLIRISSAVGNRDITIGKKTAKDIQKMAGIFIKELKKSAGNPNRL